MRVKSPLAVLAVALCAFFASPAFMPSSGASAAVAGTLVEDGQTMAYAKANPYVQPYQAAWTAAINAGNRHLLDPVLTVMHKPQTAASGNKHDYLSLMLYYWPNPDTADGLPYVYRD